jgi:maleate isomerase
MQASGIRRPWTTSGAVVKALTALHARTVVIIHPYAADVADRLAVFLADAGIDVVAGTRIDVPVTEVDSIDATSLTDLVLGTDLTYADAVFISCTNVPTYDVIAPLELQLGIPVVTANQAGMWATLRAVGMRACGPGQALLATSQPSSRRI